MVSAVCPMCTIYLIEANSADSSDLDTAEAEAVNARRAHHQQQLDLLRFEQLRRLVRSSTLPASCISPRPATAATTTTAIPRRWQASSRSAARCSRRAARQYSETAWNGAGGGCSNNGSGTGVTKPSWQHDPDCTYRTDADVSAVASGVAEYDTYGYGGWFTVGGTSVASPLIGGVYGLAGNARSKTPVRRSGR